MSRLSLLRGSVSKRQLANTVVSEKDDDADTDDDLDSKIEKPTKRRKGAGSSGSRAGAEAAEDDEASAMATTLGDEHVGKQCAGCFRCYKVDLAFIDCSVEMA